MRISIRVVAAADRSYTRFPFPRASLQECVAADNKIDRVKAQMAFALDDDSEYRPFMSASDDDELVYWTALTFMDIMSDSFETCCSLPEANIHRGAVTREDKRLEKRMDGGKFVTAKIDIRRTAEGVRVKLSVDNRQGVVGQAEQEAWSLIATTAQVWLRIMRQVKWIALKCDDPEIIERAKRNNRIAELRHDFKACERRVNNYCSPSKIDCPLYQNGKCRFDEVCK